jgi:hypothetical protein
MGRFITFWLRFFITNSDDLSHFDGCFDDYSSVGACKKFQSFIYELLVAQY